LHCLVFTCARLENLADAEHALPDRVAVALFTSGYSGLTKQACKVTGRA
jgi:hypothetical protein